MLFDYYPYDYYNNAYRNPSFLRQQQQLERQRRMEQQRAVEAQRRARQNALAERERQYRMKLLEREKQRQRQLEMMKMREEEEERDLRMQKMKRRSKFEEDKRVPVLVRGRDGRVYQVYVDESSLRPRSKLNSLVEDDHDMKDTEKNLWDIVNEREIDKNIDVDEISNTTNKHKVDRDDMRQAKQELLDIDMDEASDGENQMQTTEGVITYETPNNTQYKLHQSAAGVKKNSLWSRSLNKVLVEDVSDDEDEDSHATKLLPGEGQWMEPVEGCVTFS